jgi:putative transposase
MKRSKCSEEPIISAIRQVESGTPVGNLCRQLGVSEATVYTWKRKYAHLGVSELRRLRQVEEENARLKRLVADLSLDKPMLSEALRKKSEARPSPGIGPLASWDISGEWCAGLSAGPVWSGVVVSEESGHGSDRPATAHSRSGPC